MCRQILVLVCFLFVIGCVCAQTPADSLPVTAIVAKGMIDVRNGKLVDRIVVLVRDGKILQAGSGLKIPKNATVISLSDSYLVPGLVDAHSHLCHDYSYELEKVPGSNIITESVMLSDAARAMLGVKNARSLLLSGYTTARDLGNSGTNADVALKKAINEGWTLGPRLYVSTRALSPVGGQFPSMDADLQRAVISKEYVEINGADDARRAVRQAIFDGADCIKIIVNNNRLVLNGEELSAIVQEAQRAGLQVAAHATQGDGPALLAIKAGVNSIEHGYTLSESTLKMMMHPGTLVAGEGKIGLIEAGYFADIIAVAENPLENILTLEKVQFVMKEGVVVKNDVGKK